MKSAKKQVSALSDNDHNVNPKSESFEAQNLSSTSINDVSYNYIKRDNKNQEIDEDDDPWKWGNMWDWYTEEIEERCGYFRLNKIPKIDFIIGQIIYHFVELLEGGISCKYIDIKSLAFDHRSLLEVKRPMTYYSIEEASKLTGIPEATICKGVSLGYFLSETVNGVWLLTDAHIQFIKSFSHLFIDAEKRFSI